MKTLTTFLIAGLVLACTPWTALADPSQLDGPVEEQGEIAGAAFRIDIPEDWNGGLIMYAHGYQLAGTIPQFHMMYAKLANDLGFAVAQSKYTRQGWAGREGILDTESLRRYFNDKYGDTYPTIIAGHSQGAAITYGTIETYPEVYDGALPMCGAGGTTLDFMKGRVFDMRVLFDHFFPGLPGSAVDFPEGKQTYAKVMAQASELVKANPEKAQWYANLVELSGPEAIPGTIAFWSEILRELQDRTGGNAFDNRDTIYTGSDDDITLNHEIARFTGEKEPMEYLRKWISLTGEISDPVLALHTIVDDLIPPSYANQYDARTVMAGTEDLFAMHYVAHVGHCNFTAEEMAHALRDLVAWIEDGNRPVPADITSD